MACALGVDDVLWCHMTYDVGVITESVKVMEFFLALNPLHVIHETCHFVMYYFMKKDSKRCCDTSTPQSIHTKDESKRGTLF